eukprot:CAMPEP_0117435760 /NCGR_PEP_ID=MMETSP0759-20121206/649_1 /TAXON_ID=63605 /ORGANISM="Percolomonas cosmopolitus, Strain WS" /LENGTH=886 /DNA_ID=CAMNT_0005227321 /DNA_START=42 /DNA_END=2702 /DNA_ORIENTATION=+
MDTAPSVGILSTSQQRSIIAFSNILFRGPPQSSPGYRYPPHGHKHLKTFKISSYEDLSKPEVLLRILEVIFAWESSNDLHWFDETRSLELERLEQHAALSPFESAFRTPARHQHTLSFAKNATQDESPMSVGGHHNSQAHSHLYSHSNESQSPALAQNHKHWRILCHILRQYYQSHRDGCRHHAVEQALAECERVLTTIPPPTILNHQSSIEDSFLMEHSTFNSPSRDDASVIVFDTSEQQALSTLIHFIIGVIAVDQNCAVVKCISESPKHIRDHLFFIMTNNMNFFDIASNVMRNSPVASVNTSARMDQENIQPNLSSMSSPSGRGGAMTRSKSASSLESLTFRIPELDASTHANDQHQHINLSNASINLESSKSPRHPSLVRSISSPSALDEQFFAEMRLNGLVKPQPKKTSTESSATQKRQSVQQNATKCQQNNRSTSTKSTCLPSKRPLTNSKSPTPITAYKPTRAHKYNQLQQQRSEASLHEFSLLQQVKKWKSACKDAMESRDQLQIEHDDLKVAYDRIRSNREADVERRMLNNSSSVLETVKAESRIFSPPSSVFAENNTSRSGMLETPRSPDRGANGRGRPMLGGGDHYHMSTGMLLAEGAPASPLKRSMSYNGERSRNGGSFLEDSPLLSSPIHNPRISEMHVEQINDLHDQLEKMQEKLKSSVETNALHHNEISLLRSQLAEEKRQNIDLEHFRNRVHELSKYKRECTQLQKRIEDLESSTCSQSSEIQRLNRHHTRESQNLRSQVQDLKARNQNLHDKNENLQQRLEDMEEQLNRTPRHMERTHEPRLVIMGNNPLRSPERSRGVFLVNEQKEMDLLDMSSGEDIGFPAAGDTVSGVTHTPPSLLDHSEIEELNLRKKQQLDAMEALLRDAENL